MSRFSAEPKKADPDEVTTDAAGLSEGNLSLEMRKTIVRLKQATAVEPHLFGRGALHQRWPQQRVITIFNHQTTNAEVTPS